MAAPRDAIHPLVKAGQRAAAQKYAKQPPRSIYERVWDATGFSGPPPVVREDDSIRQLGAAGMQPNGNRDVFLSGDMVRGIRDAPLGNNPMSKTALATLLHEYAHVRQPDMQKRKWIEGGAEAWSTKNLIPIAQKLGLYNPVDQYGIPNPAKGYDVGWGWSYPHFVEQVRKRPDSQHFVDRGQLASPRDAFISRVREGDHHVLRQAARNKTAKGLRSPSRWNFAAPTIDVPGAPGLGQALSLGKGAVSELVTKPAVDVLKATAGMTTGAGTIKTPGELLHRLRRATGAAATVATTIAAPETKALSMFGPTARAFAMNVGGKIKYVGAAPARRIATSHPEWEIIHNRAGEGVINIHGFLKEFDDKLETDLRKSVNQQIADYARGLGGTFMDSKQRKLYERGLQQSIERRGHMQIPKAFSAVKAGADVPHASITMRVGKKDVYVPEAANLHEIQSGKRGWGFQVGSGKWIPGMHVGEDVPPEVMNQLMYNAFTFHKPVEAHIIQPRLSYLLRTKAQREGWKFTDKGPYRKMDKDALKEKTKQEREIAEMLGYGGPGESPPAGFTASLPQGTPEESWQDQQLAEATRRVQEAVARHPQVQPPTPTGPAMSAEERAMAAQMGLTPRQFWLQTRAARQAQRPRLAHEDLGRRLSETQREIEAMGGTVPPNTSAADMFRIVNELRRQAAEQARREHGG